MTAIAISNHSRKLLIMALLGSALVGLAAISWTTLSNPRYLSDWEEYFRPASLELLAGRTPYSIPGVANPPWIFLPLIPLAVLPIPAGKLLLFLGSVLAFMTIARKLHATLSETVLLLLAYPVIIVLILGQIDGLVGLGLILPPQLGLFLLLAKPQVGLGPAVVLFAVAWRRGGWQEALRLFGPVGAAYALSFLIFGFYLGNGAAMVSRSHNVSFWPLGIPIGLALLASVWRSPNLGLSVTASPFLSPYLGVYSWAMPLFGLIGRKNILWATVTGTWIALAVRLITY